MQIHADIFPAFVSITPADIDIELSELRSAPPSRGSFQVAIARVVITRDRVIVARDAGNGPEVVFSEPIDTTTYFKSQTPATQDSYVQTVSGKKIAFRKDSACGCGSRLRSWNPYGNTMHSTADPTA